MKKQCLNFRQTLDQLLPILKKGLIPFLFVTLFTFNSNAITVDSGSRYLDSLALVAFYEATDGPNWSQSSGWLTDNLEDWYGIYMSGNRVSQISLSYNGLSGSIPDEFGRLTAMQYLYLYNADLSEGISDSIGNLSSLISLQLNNCNITDLPSTISELSNVTSLYLGNNDFSGGIPESIFELTNIGYLDLSYCQITDVPAAISNLESMYQLQMSGNDFSAGVPNNIFSLTSLSYLTLQYCQITDFPSTLSNMSGLYELNLYGNNFSSGIPSSIFALDNLTNLNVGGCQLTDISSGISGMTNLEYLYIYSNNFSAGFPEAILGLNSLTQLNINSSQLSSLPEGLWDLTSLQYLYLSSNLLSGDIPSAVSNLENLYSLDLSYNYYSGEIPVEIGNLTNLTNLYIRYNDLSGEIPSEMGNLTNLRYIYLEGNELSGEIPSELGNLTSLNYLFLAKNNLSGEIPESFGNFSSLYHLALGENNLSGSIPSQLGELSSLQNVGLAKNNFTGSLPSGFGSISSLRRLNIKDNSFTGLPDLTSLTSLYFFDISNNIISDEDISTNSSVITHNEGQRAYTSQESQMYITGSFTSWYYGIEMELIDVNTWYASGVTISGDGEFKFANDANINNATKDWNDPECDGVANPSRGDLTNINTDGECIPLGTYHFTFNDSTYQYSYATDVGLNVQDSLALVKLYESTGGADWNENEGWLVDPIADWYGVTAKLTGLQIRVTALELSENNLDGSIPSELGNLDEVAILDLSHNNLTGSIPSSFADLALLQELTLNGNDLSGEIPSDIKNWTLLQSLELYDNNLSGEIPEDIGYLTNLVEMNLSKNKLTGTLPEGVGAMESLTSLNLSYNQLSGDLPDSISKMESIEVLTINDNKFSGTFPDRPETLSSLYMSDNEFSGVPEFYEPIYLELGNNRLLFSDMEPIISYIEGSFEQKAYGTAKEKIFSVGSSVTLNPGIPEGATGDNYQWYKKGVEIEEENSVQLGLNDLKSSDAGQYTLKVTNNEYEQFDGITISIEPITLKRNTPPVFVDGRLNVGKGLSIKLTETRFKITDGEHSPEQIKVSITQAPANGTLKVSDYELSVNSDFVLSQAYSGNVTYTHDDSETALDSMIVSISDGLATTSNVKVYIDVQLENQTPELVVNNALSVTEGKTVLIRNTNLRMTDLEEPTTQQYFIVTSLPNHGSVLVDGTTLGVNGVFTQRQVNQAKVSYTHDDSDTELDSIVFAYTDSVSTAVEDNALIVNIEPILDETAPIAGFDTLYINSSNPTLSGTIDDPKASVYVTLANQEKRATNKGDGSWVLSGNSTPYLSDGFHDVILRAVDTVQNTSIDTLESHLFVDTKTPAITVSKLTTHISQPEISGSIDDASAELVVKFNGLELVPEVQGTKWFIASGSYDSLAPKTYEIVATASDKSGNVGTDATFNELKILSQDPGRAKDSLALTKIYEATGGGDWFNETNWLTGPITGWFGVTVVNDRVTQVDLSSNGLTGSSPVINEGLDKMDTLDMSDNDLTNVNINGFTNLSALDISANRMVFTTLSAIRDKFADVVYDNQKPVLTRQRVLLQLEETATLKREVPGAESYLWLKDGVSTGETGTSITIQVFSDADEAAYTVEATSSEFPDLTLTTQPIDIRVSSLRRDEASLRLVLDELVTDPSKISVDWNATPVEDWDEITLSAEADKVIGINLANKGLEGDMPEDILDVSGFTSIDISGNNIKSIPLMDELSNLSSMQAYDNNLTFKSIVPNFGNSAINFGSQRPIGKVVNDTLPKGQDHVVSITTGGEGLRYQWYRDGDAIYGAVGRTYSINDIDYDNMGVYTVSVTSTKAPGITLQSLPQTILAYGDIEFFPGFSYADGERDLVEEGVSLLLKIVPNGPYDTTNLVSITDEKIFFPKVVLGDYLLAARAADNYLKLKDISTSEGIITDSVQFIPTYYLSELEWDSAQVLELRDFISDTLEMLRIPPPLLPSDGDGILDMVVETNFDDGTGRIEARRRVQKAGCSLRKRTVSGGGKTEADDEWELIAYQETNDEGEVNFGFLPNGTYRINIQYPGIPMDPDSFIEFEISEEEEEDGYELAATVFEDGIQVEVVEELGWVIDYFKELNVFPNPADDKLSITYQKLNNKNVMYQLTNLSGQVVREGEMVKGHRQAVEIDTEEVENGLYILRFYDKTDVSKHLASYKVYIQH
jgi:Leucine-rich repeat (LRR) protein